MISLSMPSASGAGAVRCCVVWGAGFRPEPLPSGFALRRGPPPTQHNSEATHTNGEKPHGAATGFLATLRYRSRSSSGRAVGGASLPPVLVLCSVADRWQGHPTATLLFTLWAC